MTNQTENNALAGLEPIGDTRMGTSHTIAAVALSLALKYHDINTIQDGALYQQYKLEGKNMKTLHLDMVFQTAIRMEEHLLGSSDRIARLVAEAVASGAEEEAGEGPGDETTTPSDSQPT